MASHLHRPGERHPEELVPDFDWVRQITILVSYDSETDTVVIDRGALGQTLVEAILEKALEQLAFTDDQEAAETAADDDE